MADKQQPIPRGTSGPTSAPSCIATSTWNTSTTPSHCYKFLHIDIAPVPWLPVGLQSALDGGRSPSCRGTDIHHIGNINPRLTPSGKLDLWLSHQLSAYKKEDLPPSCVKPIPFPIIPQTANLCCTANTPIAHTITDMLLLFFFYLL